MAAGMTRNIFIGLGVGILASILTLLFYTPWNSGIFGVELAFADRFNARIAYEELCCLYESIAEVRGILIRYWMAVILVLPVGFVAGFYGGRHFLSPKTSS